MLEAMAACVHHFRDALTLKLVVDHTTTPGLHEADNNATSRLQRETTYWYRMIAGWMDKKINWLIAEESLVVVEAGF